MQRPLHSLHCGCFKASPLQTRVGVRGCFKVYLRMHEFLFSMCQQPGRGCSITNKLHHLTTETSKINMEHGGEEQWGRCRRRGGRTGWLQPGVVMSPLPLRQQGCAAQSDASRGMRCHVRRRRPGRVLVKKAPGSMRVSEFTHTDTQTDTDFVFTKWRQNKQLTAKYYWRRHFHSVRYASGEKAAFFLGFFFLF